MIWLTGVVEVEALDPPTEALQKTIDSMQQRGVKILYGRWLIEGAPRVLLFDTGSAWSRLDEWKGDLWNVGGIPAPPGDHETNETIVFGYLVAWFLGEVSYSHRSMLTVVCFSRNLQSCHCSFPRMARGNCSSTLQKTSHRCHYNFHHPRHFARTILVCWISGLLQ